MESECNENEISKDGSPTPDCLRLPCTDVGTCCQETCVTDDGNSTDCKKQPTNSIGTANSTNMVGNSIPSVYSSMQILRHKHRIEKLNALNAADSEDSDSEESNDCNYNSDLDINLRIFEDIPQSADNKVVGEVHCNIKENVSLGTNYITDKDKTTPNTDPVPESSGAECSVQNCVENSNKSDTSEIASNDDETADVSFRSIASETIRRKRVISESMKTRLARQNSIKENDKRTVYELIYSKTPRKKLQEVKKETTSVTNCNDNAGGDVSFVSEVDVIEEQIKDDEFADGMEVDSSAALDDALPVPRLKVGPDGQLVLDTDSLTIERSGVAKARAQIANSKVIDETKVVRKQYGRKYCHTKPWAAGDTVKFYLLLNKFGTDFTMIAEHLPGRTRNCVKRKFKKEEEINSQLISKTMFSDCEFDIQLIEQIIVNKGETDKEQEGKRKKKKVCTARQKKPKVKLASPVESLLPCLRRSQRKHTSRFDGCLHYNSDTNIDDV